MQQRTQTFKSIFHPYGTVFVVEGGLGGGHLHQILRCKRKILPFHLEK